MPECVGFAFEAEPIDGKCGGFGIGAECGLIPAISAKGLIGVCQGATASGANRASRENIGGCLFLEEVEDCGDGCAAGVEEADLFGESFGFSLQGVQGVTVLGLVIRYVGEPSDGSAGVSPSGGEDSFVGVEGVAYELGVWCLCVGSFRLSARVTSGAVCASRRVCALLVR